MDASYSFTRYMKRLFGWKTKCRGPDLGFTSTGGSASGSSSPVAASNGNRTITSPSQLDANTKRLEGSGSIACVFGGVRIT